MTAFDAANHLRQRFPGKSSMVLAAQDNRDGS